MVTRLRHLHIECLDNTSPTLREVARRTDTESEFETDVGKFDNYMPLLD